MGRVVRIEASKKEVMMVGSPRFCRWKNHWSFEQECYVLVLQWKVVTAFRIVCKRQGKKQETRQEVTAMIQARGICLGPGGHGAGDDRSWICVHAEGSTKGSADDSDVRCEEKSQESFEDVWLHFTESLLSPDSM